MRFLGLCLLFLSLPTLAGIQLTTQIVDVDYGKKTNDDVLVFLSSGHVAKLNRSEKSLTSHVDLALNSHEYLNISLDDNRFIQGMNKAVVVPTMKMDTSTPVKSVLEQYVPTTVESMEKAKQYFREQRHAAKPETQCFNRAHVWSYEWWKAHSLRSQKLLIFFSRNYIRRYDFEWWFHIAPYIHVMDNGKVLERVMDKKYSGGPLSFRKWANIFLRNDAPCPVITKYSDYAENPYTGECYLYRTHMYSYQPADLQMYEAWGYTKNAFNMNEVKGAYLEAFTAAPPTGGVEGGATGGETSGTEGGTAGGTTGGSTGETTGGTF